MRYLIFILLIVSVSPVFAAADTTTIVKLNDRALEMAYSDPVEAMKLAERALVLSRKTGFKRGEVRAHIRKGIIYDVQSKNKEAIREYAESLKLAQSTNDQKAIASNYNNLGLIYYKVNEYNTAIKYFNKAYSAFVVLKDEENLGSTSNNLGLIREEMARYPKALSSYKISLAHYKKAGNAEALNDVYTNIGMVYSNMGKTDLSLRYTNLAIAGYRKSGNKYGLGIALNNLAITYKRDNERELSIPLLNESMEVSKEIGNTFSYVSSGYNLSQTYEELRRNDESFVLLKDLYLLLPEIESHELGYKICFSLSSEYFKRGENAKGEKMLREFKVHHDAYFSESMTKNYIETEQKFAVKEEQQRARYLLKVQDEEHQRINLLWAGGLILLVLSGLLAFFIIRKGNLQKQLESQKAVFDATMEERKRISYDLHDHVGSQLSYVVNNLELIHHLENGNDRVSRTFAMSQAAMSSLRDTVWALHTEELTVESLGQRMENVAAKTAEQQPDLELSLIVSAAKDEVIAAQTTMHIMRIFQEAVHNVVKHAKATQLTLNFSDSGSNYELSISDNGIGLEEDAQKPFHYGLQSMRERAGKIGGNITFRGNSPKGTSVVLSWPKNNSNA